MRKLKEVFIVIGILVLAVLATFPFISKIATAIDDDNDVVFEYDDSENLIYGDSFDAELMGWDDPNNDEYTWQCLRCGCKKQFNESEWETVRIHSCKVND